MKYLTHRCGGSLTNEVSIRYCKQFKNLDYPGDYEAWRLYKYKDEGWGNGWLDYVSEIHFCPYCGKELKEVEE